MGIGLTRLSAQKGNLNGSRSLQGWSEYGYGVIVYSGGEVIDYLVGGVRVHFVAHFKNGSFLYETDQIKGEVTNGYGEVFELKEVDKYNFTDGMYLTSKFNLIGDQGTHYIGSLTYNFLTGEIMVGKAVSP
jgi:hypothetical protein